MATEHLDDNGNPRVDFVWGNVPMQPNYGRIDSSLSFGGGYNQGDNQWDSAHKYISDTLQDNYTVWEQDGWFSKTVETNHEIATMGYSNFPGFIPNYAGDEDAGLETVIPAIVGKSLWQAQDDLYRANLDWDYEWYYTLGFWKLETDGSTGKAWMAEWPDLTQGLRVGDVLWFNWCEGNNCYSKLITLTGKGYDEYEDSSTLEFKINEPIAEHSYNGEIWGNMFAGSEDTYGRVLAMDNPWSVGNIVDEGNGVYFYVLGDD